MSRYELSINVNYVRNWGLNEGLREFFQNAIDAGNYSYTYCSGILEIRNKDTYLRKETLLLGCTTKNDGTSIGQFGEGYKLASLVLTRLGYHITIYNGSSEIWKPNIIKSRRYGSDILVFDVTKVIGKNNCNDLVVVIEGISEDDFENYKKYNLNVDNLIDSLETINTSYGEIILDKEYSHKIYVEGLYVTTNEDYECGYNFKSSSVTLNRDRDEIVGSIAVATSYMWSQVIQDSNNNYLFNNMDSELLDSIVNHYDMCHIDWYLSKGNNYECLQTIYNKAYKAIYNDNIPINDDLKEVFERLNRPSRYDDNWYNLLSIDKSLRSELYDEASEILKRESETLYNELTDLFDDIRTKINDNNIEDRMDNILEKYKDELESIVI